MLRILLSLTSALLLAGCAGDPVASPITNTKVVGTWQIENDTDRITGAPLTSAFNTAPSSHSTEYFAKHATMQLTCFNKKPLVRFSFEVKAGTSTSNELAYRFDEKPGHTIKARFLGDDRVAVIEDGADVTQFINQLATSKTLYLRIRSLGHGRSSADFNVADAPAAIAATTAHCPAVIEPPKPKKKSRR